MPILHLQKDAGYLVDEDGKLLQTEDGAILLDENRPCYIGGELVTAEEYRRTFERDIAPLECTDIDGLWTELHGTDIVAYLCTVLDQWDCE